MNALTATEYNFPGQTKVYHGKVRDVYTVSGNRLVMVATDRISAFDVILPKGIPFKGQILNQIAAQFLDATADICPNWKLATPDPMVTVGVACEGYPVEMIVRGYLCGSAWRAYKSGVREICGVKLPDGMRENERFPEPIITPTTKAEIGEHDEDISREEIIAQGLVSEEEYKVLEQYTLALFKRGSEIAAERGLILVDTKYEFGKCDGKIYLMDEIHTPDSSRYFYAEGYEENFAAGKAACKSELRDIFGLDESDAPIAAVVSRLVEHKGFDLVKNVAERLVNEGYQLVVLGTGEGKYEHFQDNGEDYAYQNGIYNLYQFATDANGELSKEMLHEGYPVYEEISVEKLGF